MRIFPRILNPLYVLALFLLSPSLLEAQQLLGVWNGFQSQLNVLECTNLTPKPLDLRFELQASDQSTIADGTMSIEEFGASHRVLNDFPILDQYGVIRLSAESKTLADAYCQVMFYRLGIYGPEYAYSLPFSSGAIGATVGTFNSFDPENRASVSYNWLSVVNTGNSNFSARIQLFALDGSPLGGPELVVENLAPSGRQDIALGHPNGEQIGLYRIIPDNNSAPYLAFLSRYGSSAHGEFRFGFPLQSSKPKCATKLPASTMDPALNWVEIANTSNKELLIQLRILSASGELKHEQVTAIPARAQEHVLVNTFLGDRAIGSVEISCADGSSPQEGFIAQSLHYGFSPDGLSLRWSYASQDPVGARSGSELAFPLNTNLGASNWLKLQADGDAAQSVLRGFIADGQLIQIESRSLSNGSSLDYPVHESIGYDSVGLMTVDVKAAEGSVLGELLRVFPDPRGGIRTIARITPLNISSPVQPDVAQGGIVSGERKVGHRVAVTFNGPVASEQGEVNPFLNYRLNVTFSQGGREFLVPGFFAADGNAAESGAEAGGKWRAYFTPDSEGLWNYEASFRSGNNVAVSLSASAGSPASFDGASGSFSVSASDKPASDFRSKGQLEYVGSRYLRFEQSREYFLKLGANSPENLLAYTGFDQTPATHSYLPHVNDWTPGDPSWRGGLGRSLIGAINYLSSVGVNTMYFLTMNVTGDGDDVWPWTNPSERFRFDVSKLDQWEIVFSHMSKRGIMLHVVTQETENDQLLNGGSLGRERKLYYRELIARFAHHPALQWNLGEENTNTSNQVRSYADYIRRLDPYDHPTVIHTYPQDKDEVFRPLLGNSDIEGASLQVADANTIKKWIRLSEQAGQPWIVSYDEQGPANVGVPPDSEDPSQERTREDVLWTSLMSGGAGVEYYFGYSFPNNDLDLEDFRSRDTIWRQSKIALDFFQGLVPYASMSDCDSRLNTNSAFCLEKAGETILLYFKDARNASIDLGNSGASYQVQWFDPRTGGALQTGSRSSVSGPGRVNLGSAPSASSQDWAVLLRR